MSAPTAKPFDPRPTRKRPDDDPYLWLEEIDGVDALAWVDARTADTLARYGDAAFAYNRDLARGMLDRPDRIPFVSRRGGLLYNFWRDDESPRAVEADRQGDLPRKRSGWEGLARSRRVGRERERGLGQVRVYEPSSEGHSYDKDNAEMALFMALGLNFVGHSIGWSAPEVSGA